MLEGTILKGYSGFYYVSTQRGTLECALRGRTRVRDQQFFPGDRVRISLREDGRGSVEEVLERKTLLMRPPVANVTLLVIVMSLGYPEAETVLLDRLLVLAEHAGIRPLVALSKVDAAEPGRQRDLEKDRCGTGYRMIATSTKTGQGLDALRHELIGETTVFAGQSGAGKTSLMNRLMPDRDLKTASLGERSRRGRHTTRHVELFPYEGGFLADTPGFNRLYMPDMEERELQHCFPEFAPYLDACRFASCLHWKEPGCAVKEHVDDLHISRHRYHHYLQFLEEIRTKEKRYP